MMQNDFSTVLRNVGQPSSSVEPVTLVPSDQAVIVVNGTKAQSQSGCAHVM